jgi:hypothetical protein
MGLRLKKRVVCGVVKKENSFGKILNFFFVCLNYKNKNKKFEVFSINKITKFIAVYTPQ